MHGFFEAPGIGQEMTFNHNCEIRFSLSIGCQRKVHGVEEAFSVFRSVVRHGFEGYLKGATMNDLSDRDHLHAVDFLNVCRRMAKMTLDVVAHPKEELPPVRRACGDRSFAAAGNGWAWLIRWPTARASSSVQVRSRLKSHNLLKSQ